MGGTVEEVVVTKGSVVVTTVGVVIGGRVIVFDGEVVDAPVVVVQCEFGFF